MHKTPPKHPKHPSPPTTPAPGNTLPNFGQPQPGPDPSGFKVPHPSDNTLYGLVDTKLVEPFPAPRGGTEPVLTLPEIWGPALGPAKTATIQAAGQIVFHGAADTGSVKGPQTEELVADAAQADLATSPANAAPAFLFHFGDWVYSFGEAKYYYDQFYAPWRVYQAPSSESPAITTGWSTRAIPPPPSTRGCATCAPQSPSSPRRQAV